MTDLVTRLLTLLRVPQAVIEHARESPEPAPNGEKLIEDFALRVGCRCPCGSQLLHQLTLVSTADCPRCGRTFGIRSIVYYRRGTGALPRPEVTIGWIFSAEKLAQRPAVGGVH